MGAHLSIRNLVKQWGEEAVVNDLSFTVPQGSLTVLLGPSGCGKSTILRMMAGLETPSDGQILIGETDITRTDPAKRGISMVFQSYALFPHLNVAENIGFGLRVRKMPRSEREARIFRAAKTIGLDDLLHRRPAQLSGGQKQRVALARAIVADQPVCLMDEPLSNLDAKLRASMRDEIRDLQQRLGLTMVYVTHDQIEAMSMADQVVLLNKGQIEQSGTPAELYEHPSTTFAARFIGMPPMNLFALDDAPALCSLADIPNPKPGAMLGIRPENLTLGTQGLAAQVSAVEYLGGETVIRLTSPAGNAMVRMPGRSNLQSGNPVCLSWQREDIHLFDEKGIRQDAL